MRTIEISISKQILQLLEDSELLHEFTISSAKNGIGCEEGSFRTPTGHFQISEKFGAGEPIYTTFKGRKPTGTWDTEEQLDDDLITSRILWLDGLDEGNLNTKERYIYIHGTNHEDKLGTPESCGCIRMNNADIIELFELVDEGTPVTIFE